MSRKKRTALLSIGMLGFVIAIGIKLYEFGRPSRTTAAMSLFKTYCMPLLHQDAGFEPNFDGLEKLPFEAAWAQPRTSLYLTWTETNCSVSDILEYFTDEERQELRQSFKSLVAAELPDFNLDPNQGFGAWDIFDLWVKHPRSDPRRMGVMLVRMHPQNVDAAQTEMIVSRPSRYQPD